jgi:polyisoprenyl-phosphate glycosyltransferase
MTAGAMMVPDQTSLGRERWLRMESRRTTHRSDPPQIDRPPRHAPGDNGGSDRSDRARTVGANESSRTIDAGELVVLIPVFNDWPSLSQLLPKLDAALAAHFLTVDVLVVDDGSTVPPALELESGSYEALRRVDVLRLRRNLGNQRAIAVGLAYIEDRLGANSVVVMDGDGEDDPADVPRLLERLEEEGNAMIVFAERARRSESRVFRLFYALFKLLHRALTGKGVRVGNFSAIPRRRLSSLVVVAELWNHYAAAAFRSRQPYCMIPTNRAHRLSGSSTMNFVSHVTHGLSAISVYSDVVGVRLLVTSILMACSTLVAIATVVIVRLATNLAIPGWASYTVGVLLILFVQAVMAAFVFSFAILGARHSSTFLPRRDYSFFIAGLDTLIGPELAIAPLPERALAGDRSYSGS